MKRFMLVIIGLMFWLGIPAFAADSAGTAPVKIEPRKASSAKITDTKTVRMRATGMVVEISDTMIKIDRSVKENREFMDFSLEKPIPFIHVGDHVTVSYITKNGINIALRVIPEKKYTKTRPKIVEKKGADKPPATATPSKDASSIKK